MYMYICIYILQNLSSEIVSPILSMFKQYI